MAGTLIRHRRREAPLYVPRAWTRTAGRDVALDLLRGLAMVVLVINHTALESPLRVATRGVLSAAEILVMVAGVVSGMVFGRRWLDRGARATTRALLLRARKLYLASVVVVGLVGLATLVPFLGTNALTISPRVPVDTYAHEGLLATLAAIVTLEAGPWQFNILGFFIAVIAVTPLVLAALARGRWPLVAAAGVALYLLGRAWHGDVLPAQSERAFPLLVWQLLFVGGLLVGWHREAIAAWVRPRRRIVVRVIVGTALALAAARVIVQSAAGPAEWGRLQALYFHKGTLDPLRLLSMASSAAALYIGFARFAPAAERVLGPVLLPLGRNSFYVFIMHVFACLAIASVPFVADGSLGPAGNVAVQVATVAALVLMVRRRVLFRWVPR